LITETWNWKSFDNLNMFSRSWSPDGKRKAVVCLVHGLGEHTGRYKHVAEAFVKQGYALAGFHLRGHGNSDGPRGHTPSPEAYFNDIDLFFNEADKRFPAIPKFLYGHSLGAMIVLAYTPQRNPKIIGTIATAVPVHSALENDKFKLFIVNNFGSLMSTMTIDSGLDPNTLSHDRAVVDAYIGDPLVHRQVTMQFGKSGQKIIKQVFHFAPQYPVPVLLMHGEKDDLGYAYGSKEIADLMPKDLVTLRMWPGMFHEIHNEADKGLVLKTMTDWMDAHLPK